MTTLTLNQYRDAAKKKTTDQLFDALSGIYSLIDNGFKPKREQLKAAIACADVLMSDRNAPAVIEERNHFTKMLNDLDLAMCPIDPAERAACEGCQ